MGDNRSGDVMHVSVLIFDEKRPERGRGPRHMIWVVYDGFWNLYGVMQVFDRLFYLGSSKYGGSELDKAREGLS